MGTSDSRDRTWSGGVHGPRRPRRARRGASLAAALLSGLGCLDLLGNVDIDTTSAEINANKAGGDRDCPDAGLQAGTCVVRCEPGRTRCAESSLQRCNDAGDGWTPVNQCASAELCDALNAVCRPPLCGAGEHRCATDGTLQVCREDRRDFDVVSQCTSDAYCIATPGRERCLEVPCRAGRERCNGPQIERCREDRSGYDVVGAPCASAALCVEGEGDAARCTPQTCVPDTFACNGSSLTRCSDDANRYLVVENCGSPERCNAAQKRCVDPGATMCVVGEQRCMGNVLQRCNTSAAGFEPVDVCATAAQCDATAASCLPPMPGTDPLPDPTVLDGPAYDFVTSASTAVLGLGPMELRVPAQWSDVDRSPWTDATGIEIGPRFIASTDAARFTRNFDIPGVYFAATEAAPVEVAARLQQFDMSARCTASSDGEYEDELYTGTVRTYTSCGVTQATTSVVIALDKADARFVTVVIVTMTAGRDDVARGVIWDSFVAD
jgi:hypothetical protein